MKQNAKTAIINSFKELLSKQSLDKITVKKICEHCNVNRQTFYYYFIDIMDIFKFIIFDEVSMEIEQNKTFNTWEGGFRATMNYLKRNSKMIYHICNSSYWPQAKAHCTNLSNKLLGDVVDECGKNIGVKLHEKDKIFIVNFYRHVFNGIMIDWVSEGMKEDPEIILRKLLIMITGSIPRSVVAFVTDEIENPDR